MVLLAPLSSFDSSDNLNRSSTVTFFGSQVDDDCDNETKDDDLPYFVNKVNGSDDNSGSVDCPFASIAKAAEAMEDGDTVVISHGMYRESISIQNKNDLIFKAAENEKVVIDGSRDIEDDLNGGWSLFQDGIYQTNLSGDAWHYLSILKEMVPARPNAFQMVPYLTGHLGLGSMDSDKYKDEDGNWVYPYENGELIDITGLNESGLILQVQ